MRSKTCFCWMTLLVLTAAGLAGAEESPPAAIDISYTKTVLDNGLTLIVHEDHKAPIVAVNVWYHVGSKNEKPGKTGFAHLFEHLMFNGSENFDDDYFQPLEHVGATDVNGTTNPDRTNYFQNVPVSALDLVLWMESDRMSNLLGAVDQERLDEQRGVVQNEKRQGENRPYGVTRRLITENTYPADHPYSWSTIGSMEDLDAASLKDVHEWFETYYGAANAVVAIAGDVETDRVVEKVRTYFGHISSGPPLARHQSWIARMEGTKRQTVRDRVPQARIYKVWNVPPVFTPEADDLELLSDLLAAGKTSRLYKRLVYEERIATDVSAFVSSRELGSQFRIQATAEPGASLRAVERAIDEELERLLHDGPSPAEVERVKARFRASLVAGVERIGGFGGKSDILARSEVYGGSPDAYKESLERVLSATPERLRTAAREWLSDGVYVLEVHPFPEYHSSASDVDRSHLPYPDAIPAAEFPALEEAALENGMRILLVPRHELPLVRLRLLVDAGWAADGGAAPGRAALVMDMLDEGTRTRSALQISEELDRLGATLFPGSDLDTCTLDMRTLSDDLDASLRLFADVALHPAFPPEELERLKARRAAGIRQEQVQPFSMGLRLLPALLYDEGHAYAQPLTGSGTVESLEDLRRVDLVDYHRTWFKPNNATLIVVGDATLETLRRRIEEVFAGWQPGAVPVKTIGPGRSRSEKAIYLLDRPDAEQSVIFAARLAPPKANPDEIAFETMNQILGGSFTSRINMNLREDKHWSYGARTIVFDAVGPRPFLARAPVQTDKTAASMRELARELRGIVGEIPVRADELEKTQASLTLRLPGRWETAWAVANTLTAMVRFGLGLDYFESYPQEVRALTLEDVQEVAREVMRPQELVWVVVGDREAIEPGLRELGWGPVVVIDNEGEV